VFQGVRDKALAPWWSVGGKERGKSSRSTPVQKGRGTGTVHLIHHSHTIVFLVLVCERRILAVLRLHFQLSSRDREVWKEANATGLHEEMNAAAAILVSAAQHHQLRSSAGWSVTQHLQHKEAACTFVNFNHCLSNLK